MISGKDADDIAQDRRGDPDAVSFRDGLVNGGCRVLAVPFGEGEQLADLTLVEFVSHGRQTLGQRPRLDEPVGLGP